MDLSLVCWVALVVSGVGMTVAEGGEPSAFRAAGDEAAFEAGAEEEDSAAAAGELFGAIGDAGAEAEIAGLLSPHFHVLGAFGGTTGEQSGLAVNDHDPQREATLQTLEPGLSLRAGFVEGFVNATTTTDAAGDFTDFTLEEGFLKIVEIPFGFELRGGQYLNRFGFQNSVHNHGWSYVDQNLVNGRFLNEGELITQGGEIAWKVPVPRFQSSVLSVSAGGVSTHDHSHGEHGHGHGHAEEAEFEAEGANFDDYVVSASWASQYDINDMNRLTGVFSGAWGDNQFGRTTQVYGVGFEYLWRANGYRPGGRSLRWRTELMYRDFGAVSGHLPGEEEDEHGHEEDHGHGHEHEEEHGHDEDHHHDEDEGHHHDGEDEHHDDESPRRASFDDFGLYTSLIYGIDDRIEAGVRAGWVSGVASAGLDDRVRVSPMLTWYANRHRTVQARLQYNWDHSDSFGDEHSVWFQLGFNWGGAEVR